MRGYRTLHSSEGILSPHSSEETLGSHDSGRDLKTQLEDVWVQFSEREWRALRGWQRALHRAVMRSNYHMLLSLGKEVVCVLLRSQKRNKTQERDFKWHSPLLGPHRTCFHLLMGATTKWTLHSHENFVCF
uniref:KRAB domain-containing protein n=1 Tax=Accipiter nisus TaxID=211598 RepID=A0A8B9MLZ1_9AVES